MVAAVHEEAVRCGRAPVELFFQGGEPADDLRVRLLVKIPRAVAVPEEMDEERAGPVGGLPPVFGCLLPRFSAEPPVHERRPDAEPPEYCGHHGDVAERIGDVPHGHRLAERRRHARTCHQVAHRRFPADEEFVGEHVPRPGDDASFADKPPDLSALAGTDGEVVLEHDGLSVECEVAEFPVAPEQIEKIVDHFHEHRAELLEALVPFPVPVGVGDDMICRFHDFRYSLTGRIAVEAPTAERLDAATAFPSAAAANGSAPVMSPATNPATNASPAPVASTTLRTFRAGIRFAFPRHER